MKCFECGEGRMIRKLTDIEHEIRGTKFTVRDLAQECDHCHIQFIPPARIAEHGRMTDEAYRAAAGLLTADQIRQAREKLGMSQRVFADYLGVGEASLKRWEIGSLPDKSSNELIRIKSDPTYAQRNLDQLCARLELESPTRPQRHIVFVHGPAGFQKPVADWLVAGSTARGKLPVFQHMASGD